MSSNVMKFLACDETVKLTCVDTTKLINDAKNIHGLSKSVTKVFGDALTVASIIGSDLKEENDNITIEIRTKSLIGNIICVAKKGAKVKGYVTNPTVDVMPTADGKINEEELVGKNGIMYIIKDMGLKEPYVGISEINEGGIINSFTNYWVKSEQIPTILSVGMIFGDNGNVEKAGGYMLQLMPDVQEKTIELLEKNVLKCGQMSELLKSNKDLVDIAKTVTGDDDILMMPGEINNEYVCDCSKERFEKGLISLGKDELNSLLNSQEKVEIKCQFCNKQYIFSNEDIRKLMI